MPRILLLAASVAGVLAVVLLVPSMGMIFGRVNAETAKYEVLHEGRDYEVRRYAPTTAIETSSAKGDNTAFQRLAGFIGVFQKAENEGEEKIAMTAPVVTFGMGQEQRMQFILPAEKHHRAPNPTRPGLRLVERPSEVFGVETFSGSCGHDDAAKRAEALAARLQQDGFQVDTSASWQYFRYNPPFTLPPFRTNEVAVPLKKVWAVQALAGPAESS